MNPKLSSARFVRCLPGVAVFLWLLAWPATLRAAINTNSEPELIAVLQSKASLQEKDAACAALKRIGTVRCVPALAVLLRDEQLSHSARYALESMNLGSAERALIDALKETSGMLKAGIINSLAARGEAPAVPALTACLRDPDPAVATAAVTALGQIGGPVALKALQTNLKKSGGPLHRAEVDALLRCGCQLALSSDPSRARKIFQQLYDYEKSDSVRVAAYRGLILSSPNGGLGLVLAGISGPPGASQVAALQSVHDLQAQDATESLAKLLPRLEPMLQVDLVGGLAQRADVAATPMVAALASSPDPTVRPAALRALDVLGDASTVPLLSEFAASGTPDEQRAARLALVDMHRGNVTDMLLNQMASAGPGVLAELSRALGDRGEKSAVPKLFVLAQRGPDSVRKAAFQALGELADESDLGPLARFVLDTKDDAARIEAAQALRTACEHIQSQRGRVNVEPLVEALAGGSAKARMALLPICSSIASPRLRLSLRAGLQDSNPGVRDVAIRTLCDTSDPDLLEDLVTLVHQEQRENFRMLALAGGVRAATQEETVKISNGQRLAVLTGFLGATRSPEEKRLVLSGIAEIPTMDALHVAESLLDQPDVQTEAARAALKIARMLPSGKSEETLAVLNKAMAATANEETHKALKDTIKQIQASADYLTDWRVAGPYRQAGRDYSALFDIVFPPEVGDSQNVNWQPLPAGIDSKRPWVMDLLKPIGGEECVAYTRTWVHCDQDEEARLELGSDDGIKVWLNDKQVYGTNVARALQPGSDLVNVKLHSGWNRLLFKITQHVQGWEFCARLLKPDGGHLQGLRCEALPQVAFEPSDPKSGINSNSAANLKPEAKAESQSNSQKDSGTTPPSETGAKSGRP